MTIHGVAAVMTHGTDVDAGLAWYQRAFPDATREHLEDFDFQRLTLTGVALEIVPSDAKIGHGAAGTVVDWRVDDFQQALDHLQACGATFYRGPIQIENGWHMCKLLDPWGNVLGLRSPILANLV